MDFRGNSVYRDYNRYRLFSGGNDVHKMKIELTHGALFQGIGGFSLAARNQGIPTIWECENNEYCQKLSRKNFPEIETRYGDIKEMIIEKDKIRPVSIVSGGFPCQPFSTAGKRNGEKDNRYLWPETFEVIRHVRPRWVILENVPGIINMVLGDIIIDLESAGYQLPVSTDKRKIVFSVPALAVGANHIRQRVWIIAYDANQFDRENLPRKSDGQVQQPGNRSEPGDIPNSKRGGRKAGRPEAGREKRQVINGLSRETRQPVAHASCQRQRHGNISNEEVFRETKTCRKKRSPIQKDFSAGNWWAIEPGVGRVANGIPSRVDRLRGLGNAIVPQVAEVFFNIISRVEKELEIQK